MDRDFISLLAAMLIAIAPIAGILDYWLDTRLLGRKNGAWVWFFTENAIAIAANSFARLPLSFELLQIISPTLEIDILELCGFKALIVALSMALRGRGSPILQTFSLSGLLSLTLRSMTIGFAAYVFIFAVLTLQP